MKKLTPDEQSYRMKLYGQGLNDRELADILYLDASVIQAWRVRNNLPANQPRYKISPEDEAERMRLYKQGMTDTEIAETLWLDKRKKGAIWYWRKFRGLPANVRPI